MNRFYRFMSGRNGLDKLSMTLIIIALLISLAATVAGIPAIGIVSWLILLYAFYRAFSRNLVARRAENYKFMSLTGAAGKRLKRVKNRANDLRTHRHYKCVKCGAELRVPQGKGKIIITCPVCQNELKAKT